MNSDQPRLAEREVGVAAGLIAADDHVINEADLQEFRGFVDAAGEAAVRFAGGWVAGGVVVDQGEAVGMVGPSGSG